jgi:hypothetical protein
MRVRPFVLLLFVLVIAACGTDPTIPPSALNVPFRLQTLNGVAIPAAVFDSANPPVRLDALSGTITIKPDNTFIDVTTFRQTVGGVGSTRTASCTGTFTSVGNVFEFKEVGFADVCGLTFTGVLSGSSLSASVLGVPAVFSQ